MRGMLTLLALILFQGIVIGQPGPAINDTERPNDSSPIVTEMIQVTKGWDEFKGGFKKGSRMPDVTFYTLNGEEVTLSKVLKETHKPVLFVTGNYSCPIYRMNIDEINSITNFYKGKLNVYVVYTVEAHPASGTQVYPTIPEAAKMNAKDGVNMKQAATYLDRRKAVTEMNKHMELAPAVVLDGPGNEWWKNAGYAPNNAYLVNTRGVIVAKNGWFNPNMWCSIDNLLGTKSGHCNIKGKVVKKKS